MPALRLPACPAIWHGDFTAVELGKISPALGVRKERLAVGALTAYRSINFVVLETMRTIADDVLAGRASDDALCAALDPFEIGKYLLLVSDFDRETKWHGYLMITTSVSKRMQSNAVPAFVWWMPQ